MKGLTYKLLYTPTKDSMYSVEESGINFLCADGKIHIRLRDYDKEEIISGFINKLTYLVTYLVNHVVDLEYAKDTFKYINSEINRMIKLGLTLHEDRYTGIKVSKNYRRIKTYSPLGSMPKDICPYSNGAEKCSVHYFLETFRTNIHDFLFNDAYEIVIEKRNMNKGYEKYINKQRKEKVKESPDRRVSLW